MDEIALCDLKEKILQNIQVTVLSSRCCFINIFCMMYSILPKCITENFADIISWSQTITAHFHGVPCASARWRMGDKQ